jgi:hypothetical protein
MLHTPRLCGNRLAPPPRERYLEEAQSLAGAGGGLPRQDRISDSGSRGLEESRVAQLQQDVTKFGVKSAISVAASAPLHAA